ncbi:hypothetical protein [Acidovorax carolinensis]|nr:hypothetical protein [Acidovorax carolinensis]
MTNTTQTTTATPIPPADSIGASVRALNIILEQISGAKVIAALRDGNACSGVDTSLWSPAWEGARNFRDQFILTLARNTRNEWRSDCAQIVASQPKSNHESHIARALDERLQVCLEFAFRFFIPRQICFLGDALMLAFESEMSPAEMAKELAGSGARTRGAHETSLSALVLGASGMHRYQPERVLASVH